MKVAEINQQASVRPSKRWLALKIALQSQSALTISIRAYNLNLHL